MVYYENNQQARNRAERRKNGIKSTKSPKYTKEQLERILKKELQDLISQPYSEMLKRERYRKLQPLIEEYKKNQKSTIEVKTLKSVSNTGKKEDRKAVYEKERQKLVANPVYQKIQCQPTSVAKPVAKTSEKMQKAIKAYEQQMQYSNIPKTQVQKSQSKVKKGFFTKFLEALKIMTTKKQEIVKKTPIRKPKTSQIPVRYHNPKPIKEVGQEIYNEFEKRLRDMNQYSKQNPSFKLYKNGRQINLEPRYL